MSWGVPADGESHTTIKDLDGDTTVTATRAGDVLNVTVSGPKRIAAVAFAPLEDSPSKAVVTMA